MRSPSLTFFKGKHYGCSHQSHRLSGRIRPYLVVGFAAPITLARSASGKGFVYHPADFDRPLGIRNYSGRLPTAT